MRLQVSVQIRIVVACGVIDGASPGDWPPDRVTVENPDGKRHMITVESASVYEPAMEFFGRSGATFPAGLAADKQRPGLRSAADLPRDAEAAYGTGEQERGAPRSLENVSSSADESWSLAKGGPLL